MPIYRQLNNSINQIPFLSDSNSLIEYTYGQENDVTTPTTLDENNPIDESDFTIKNFSDRAVILDQDGKPVFRTDGQLKYLCNKLYRINLKRECFTLKGMVFNGSVWIKGIKKIVAYPQSELYQKIIDAADYCDEVEDIVDSPNFEDCKLKVGGIWYTYNGYSITDYSTKNDVTINYPNLGREFSKFHNSPLYDDRKQTVLREMEHFRVPVKASTGTKKKPSVLRIIRADGTIIECEKAATAFCQAIKEIGVEKVYSLKIPMDCMHLVTIGGNTQCHTAQHDVGNGYFVNTHSSTINKKRQLERIFKAFNLSWKVEIVESN